MSDLRRISVNQERRLSRSGDYVPIGDIVTIFALEASCDIGRLAAAVRALQLRHDSLASRFLWDGDFWQAEVVREPNVGMRQIEVGSGATAADVVALIESQTLSLTEPVRVTLCDAGPRRYLAISFDHLVGDGISRGVVASDLIKLYAGVSLPPAKSYYALSENRREWLASAEAMEDIDYWRSVQEKATLYPSLWNVQNGMRGDVSHRGPMPGAAVTVSVPRYSVDAAYRRFREFEMTPFSGWLTSLVIAVRRISDAGSMVGVSSFCHGRFSVDEQDAVGDFAYSIPILFDYCEPSFRSTSRMVQGAFLKSLERARVPRWLIPNHLQESQRPIFVFEVPPVKVVDVESSEAYPLVPLNSIYRSSYRFERTEIGPEVIHASQRKILNGVHLSAQPDDEGNWIMAVEFRLDHATIDFATELARQWRDEFLRYC